MILEHAILHVRDGEEVTFEHTLAEALALIETAPHCYGAEVRRQIEDPSVFLLEVRWESVTAHLDFRATELFNQWRVLTHHFYDVAPEVSHFDEPVER